MTVRCICLVSSRWREQPQPSAPPAQLLEPLDEPAASPGAFVVVPCYCKPAEAVELACRIARSVIVFLLEDALLGASSLPWSLDALLPLASSPLGAFVLGKRLHCSPPSLAV